MFRNTPNIIEKQVVELEFSNQKTHFVLQDRISNYFKYQFKASLDSLFEQLIDKNTYIKINRLEINVGAIPFTDFENHLNQKIIEQLTSILQKGSTQDNPEIIKIEQISGDVYYENSLTFFLENGYFKQNFKAIQIDELKQWLFTTKGIDYIKKVFQNEGEKAETSNYKTLVIHRFIDIFKDETIEQIIIKMIPQVPFVGLFNDLICNELSLISNHSKSDLKYTFYKTIFIHLAKRKTESLNQTFDQVFSTFFQIYLKKIEIKKLVKWFEKISKKTKKLKNDWVIQLKVLIEKIVINQVNESHLFEDTTIIGLSTSIESIFSDKVITPESNLDYKKNLTENTSKKQKNKQEANKDTEKIGQNSILNPNKLPSSNPKNVTNKNLENGIYLTHAGVVLVHPFLKPFFTELDLLENQVFKDTPTQQKAVQVLAYIATGSDYCEEYEMPIFKILCGMAIEDYVSPELNLTTKEKEAVTELLAAIKKYWTPLDKSSDEGLRESFFRRDGKLSQADDGLKLTIERKTIDILLDKLPWGISLIKLQWMPQMLYVDWT